MQLIPFQSARQKCRSSWLALAVVATIHAGMMAGCSKPPPQTIANRGKAETRLAQTESVEKEISRTSPPVSNRSLGTPMLAGAIGSEQCATCHSERAESFFQTSHARSLRKVDGRQEPECDSYEHEPSSQTMKVARVGNRIHHQSRRRLPQTDFTLPLHDVPIELVMGSGTFAKSYLYRDGSSLLQSPLTHYTQRNEYDLSPGYDSQEHFGFSRQVTDECLFCHAGSLSRVAGNRNASVLHEMAIGCERCHGGGRQHAAIAAANRSEVAGEGDIDDWAIVHPGKLNRNALESLCAQCHLQGDIQLFPRDADSWSFDAGDDLGRTRIVYNVGPKPTEPPDASRDGTNGFVGHFEQMHASECYQRSDDLTCVTCHDPHHATDPEVRDQLHRNHCLSCHDNQACGIPLESRLNTHQNSCHACHMPTGKSEVPHVSITNHRVAVYRSDQSLPPTSPQPKFDATQLPIATALLDRSKADSWQRELNEATAIAQWLWMGSDVQFRNRTVFVLAIDRLRTAIQVAETSIAKPTTGEAHPHVSLQIAKTRLASLIDGMLKFPKDASTNAANESLRSESRQLMEEILRNETQPTPEVQISLEGLAKMASADDRYQDAYNLYQRLISIRRNPVDFYNFGLACGKLRRFAEAETAMLESIRIQPVYPLPYASLGKLYRTIDPQTAVQYEELSRRLRMKPVTE